MYNKMANSIVQFHLTCDAFIAGLSYTANLDILYKDISSKPQCYQQICCTKQFSRPCQQEP